MSDVQRYEPEMDSSETFQGMNPMFDGDYVEYTDYAKLQAENERLRKEKLEHSTIICEQVEMLNNLQAVVDAFCSLEIHMHYPHQDRPYGCIYQTEWEPIKKEAEAIKSTT